MKDIGIIFQEKRILVMGLGVTGTPVIRSLAALGNHIVGLDNNTLLDRGKILSDIGSLSRGSVDIILEEEEDIREKLLKGISLVITSPGIPSGHKIFAIARERDIPVWDELELSYRLLSQRQRANMIAVTGTNGKTTVVNLTSAVLREAGMDNRVCGNIGFPVLDTIGIDRDAGKAKDDDIIRVVEVSSFQLERTYSFRPGIGILLNITSDHMDRHGTIEEYSRMKMRLFSRQGKGDFAIINADDRIASLKISEVDSSENAPTVIRYGTSRKDYPAVWYEKGQIRYELPSGCGKINIEGSLIRGMHNMSNAAASAAAALIMGVGYESAGKSIRGFRPLEHRMEYLGEISGVRCINDSKSTNPDSVIAALRDFSKEVTIIMGGLDKGMDFTPVIPSLSASVNNIILIGKSAPAMQKLFSSRLGGIGIHTCCSLEDAVSRGFEITRKQDVLLLSPGCASMDMFRDYKDRGERFKKAVMGLRHGS